MRTVKLPSCDKLRELLDYDPETGKLIWKPRTTDMFQDAANGRAANICAIWNSRYAGTEALGRINAGGYKCGKVNRGSYLAHRVIWALIYGADPEFVDHISGVRSDNRLSNLRNVTRSENAKNRAIGTANTSGHIGVHWCNYSQSWRAQIADQGRQRVVGQFGTKAEALACRLIEQNRLGFHLNHGRAA